MYYILYLASLCKRRRWPDPHYETYPYGGGFACNVRVNHRDYAADEIHATQELAREAAAKTAYLMCRNISMSEGIYAGQAPGSGMTAQQPITSQYSGSSIASSASMSNMAQPRYVPPTGNIVQGGNGMPRADQGQMSSGGRMSDGSNVVIIGHPQMGL